MRKPCTEQYTLLEHGSVITSTPQKSSGCIRGNANPCVFNACEKNVRLVVHDDDFTKAGFCESLAWFRWKPAEIFDVKFRAKLGEGTSDDERDNPDPNPGMERR